MENERVKQIRTNALVAETMYTKLITKLDTIRFTINVLTIIVPIMFSAAQFLLKGTSWESVGNITSVILSAALLALSVYSLIIGTDEKNLKFHIGRNDNIYVSNEALRLMASQDVNLEWFFNYVSQMDMRDSSLFGAPDENLKKEAYREALKKLIPGSSDIVCPVCKASPFKFTHGTCQVCGNTPKEK